MLSRLFHRDNKVAAAHELYTAIIAQARRPEFYTQAGVPDSVDGRFDLMVMHAFAVMHRLGEGKAVDLSQALFDLMFADFDQNLREMGASDIAVGGKVKKMVTAFYGRAEAYAATLGDHDQLAEAIARNLYRGAPPDAKAPVLMADYLLALLTTLGRQDMADLKKGRVAFIDPMMP